MFYVYVLHSNKDGHRYIGYTSDLKQRLIEHEKGHVDSTRDRRPFKLIYYEACIHQQDATAREKYLKTGWGRLYLNKRLKHGSKE